MVEIRDTSNPPLCPSVQYGANPNTSCGRRGAAAASEGGAGMGAAVATGRVTVVVVAGAAVDGVATPEDTVLGVVLTNCALPEMFCTSGGWNTAGAELLCLGVSA